MLFRFCMILLVFFAFGCAGFSHPAILNTPLAHPMIPSSVRIQFTGFGFYEKEKQMLRESILESGYKEEINADLLLEIKLEEVEHHYEKTNLHRLNFVFSLVSATIIPYQIYTDHKITYRYAKEKVIKESEYGLRLSQYRGILVLLISPFYWPSSGFYQSIDETWTRELQGR
ncbi:hypothetical protein [Leptospira sp. 'Mane']|uniref:hypothetical protein n=1 Tax=Leptospira sp. 'Mane' TaxID=3387407 RepID=UPI00398B72A5